MSDFVLPGLTFPRGKFAAAIWEKVTRDGQERRELAGLFFGETQEMADRRAKEWVEDRIVSALFEVGPVVMKPADA